jgi:hypothetical protein
MSLGCPLKFVWLVFGVGGERRRRDILIAHGVSHGIIDEKDSSPEGAELRMSQI